MRPHLSGSRNVTTLVGALLAVLAGGGCDGGGAMFVGPSRGVPASALVSAAIAAAPGKYVSFGCAAGGALSPGIALTISAWSTIDLDRVTIQLLDGSHVGGPMVPFPSASLVSQFGSVRVFRGETRVFVFHPSVPCGPAPRFVSAAFVYRDPAGGHHDGLAQGPWTGPF